MTVQSDHEHMENIPPEVISEEDAPFDSESKDNEKNSRPNETGDPLLAKEIPTKNMLDIKKFNLGSSILGWCLFLMMFCIFLSLWKPDNELVISGFEAFKLIVMTILGYIFGSNNSKME